MIHFRWKSSLFIFILCVICFGAGFFTHTQIAPKGAEPIHGSQICDDAMIMLDEEYTQQIAKAVSNLEICEINEEFAERYEEIISSYEMQILHISNETLKLELQKEQTAWKEYVPIYLDMRFSHYEQLYQGGSMVPVAYSKAKCELYRQRALFLYEIYTDEVIE